MSIVSNEDREPAFKEEPEVYKRVKTFRRKTRIARFMRTVGSGTLSVFKHAAYGNVSYIPPVPPIETQTA